MYSPGYATYIPAGPSAYRPPVYATPTKGSRRHVRSGSHDVPPTYTWTARPPPPPQFVPAQTYAQSPQGPYAYSSPPPPQPHPGAQYVSGFEQPRASVRRPKAQHQQGGHWVRVPVHPDGYFEDEGYSSPGKGGLHYAPPNPPSGQYPAPAWTTTDPYATGQVPRYRTDPGSTPKRKSSTRHRSASYSNHHEAPKQKSTPKHVPRKATAKDARDAKIPAGYDYSHWDPDDEPIMLCGSIFDANSLGKWIYDFTVHNETEKARDRGGFVIPPSEMPKAKMAGDLWLLLIQLAGKMRRAEDCRPRIRHKDDLRLVREFIDSGDRLWDRLSRILQECERQMKRTAKKEAKKKRVAPEDVERIPLSVETGRVFVETMFGRDRELDNTMKLQEGLRFWSHRFDANVEDIIRHPDA